MITIRFLALALVLTTACDQPDDGTDASTGASSTSDAASTGPELDVLAASTGDDTTGDASTSDEGSGGFGGSGGETCFGASCIETGCAPGLVCAPHPDTAEPLCVTLCAPPFACNEVVPFACGTVVVECRVDVDGPAMCFPVL